MKKKMTVMMRAIVKVIKIYKLIFFKLIIKLLIIYYLINNNFLIK